jgi:hypothetical protein
MPPKTGGGQPASSSKRRKTPKKTKSEGESDFEAEGTPVNNDASQSGHQKNTITVVLSILTLFKSTFDSL